MYKNIKSSYVKDRIKETSWSEKKVIDDLLVIEHFLSVPPKGFVESTIWNSLINRYENETLSISEEIDPQIHLKLKARFKDMKDKLKTSKQNSDLETEKMEWLEAGGKP